MSPGEPLGPVGPRDPRDWGDREVDAEFARIIGDWGDTPEEPSPETAAPEGPRLLGRPDATQVAGLQPPSEPSAEAPVEPTTEPFLPPPPGVNPSPLEQPVWRESSTSWLDQPEEHFEPDPAPLPPQEDIGYWGTVLALAAGVVLLLGTAVLRPASTGFWAGCGILLLLVGFVLLVLRLPRERDEDDTGAVV